MVYLLPSPDKPISLDKPIIRSLVEGPDYKPDWRLRLSEQYLLQISQAKDMSAATDLIVSKECDPFVRQLVRFHSGRGSIIATSIEYALRCDRYAHTTRVPALIKAMIAAGQTTEEIAKQVSTTAMNIRTFEKLSFDVRRYINNRVWLRDICFPVLSPDTAFYQQYESRALGIAYEGGWPRLQNLLLSQQSERAVSVKSDLDQLVALLAARALDYIVGLEVRGVLPTARDLEFLLLTQSRMPMVALPPFSAGERTADPATLRKKIEVEQKVKKLSPLARDRIRRLIEFIKSDHPLDMDAKLGVQQPSADASTQ